MDVPINVKRIKKFIKDNMFLFTKMLVILNVLLIFLIASLGVDILNKVKENKYIGQDLEVKNTITVSDSGEVYAKPDLALTTFSVVTEATTVVEAMAQNTEKMNAVINFVKGEGVADKDLKTTSFNISPRYEWHEEKDCSPPCPSGKRVLVGYDVRQSLQVKIRDMEKIGQIIEGAAKAGVNQIGSLQFIIDQQDELKKQARGEAIKKAKAKAKELASQLGVSLVRITNFAESGALPRYYAFEAAMSTGGGIDAQIETGENKISVTVSITYEIN